MIAIAWAIILMDSALVAYLRLTSLHMTEGQILAAYWPAWACVVASVVLAVRLLRAESKGTP